jgi:hypothetical protein
MALLGAACLQACSSQFSAAPLSAQVVDADTGGPVAGVHVVADWQLEGGMEGGNILGAVTVLEAQSDERGWFRFPGWGPKEVDMPSGVYANARIRGRAPGLILFKSGYAPLELRNHGGEPAGRRDMRSEWDGKRIALKPFHGSPAQYADALSFTSSSLITYTVSRHCTGGEPCPAACQWQNIPNAIRAIGRLFAAFEAQGIRHDNIHSFLLRNDGLYQRVGCASAALVLGGNDK